MRPRFLLLLISAFLWTSPALRAEADLGTAPGAAAPVPQQPVPSAAVTAAPVARKEDEPTFLERIRSYASSRNTLTASINAAERELVDLRAAVEERDATITTLRAEVAAQRADLERIGAYLQSIDRGAAPGQSTAAAFAAAVSGEVANTVSKLGIPAASITQTPTASGSTKEERLDAIRAEIAATTDPAKRGILAAEARKLRHSN
jgi:hypothetical protein